MNNTVANFVFYFLCRENIKATQELCELINIQKETRKHQIDNSEVLVYVLKDNSKIYISDYSIRISDDTKPMGSGN